MTTMFLGAFGVAAPEPVHAAGSWAIERTDGKRISNLGSGDTISWATWKSAFGLSDKYKGFSGSSNSSVIQYNNANQITIKGLGTTELSMTFSSGNSKWTINVVQTHTHTWNDNSYSASGNVITATCQGSGTCDLTKPTLTLNASGKTYDGNQVTATLTKSDTWTSQGLTTPTITYSPANSKNVGTYTASATVGNATATQQFTISKKELTVTGLTANDKVYDGTDAADLNTSGAALSGVVSGDVVQIDEITGVYTAGKDAGNGKAISATATLKGTDAGNYEISPISLTANISKKDIKLIKVYIKVLERVQR